MTRWTRRLLPIVLISLLALPAVVRADEPSDYSRANQDYFAGRYSEAARRYEALLQEHGEVPALLLNLGNCRFQLGELGLATWYFRRALKLGEGEVAGRAESNLRATRQALLELNRKRLDKGIISYDESHGVWPALFTYLPLGTTLPILLALLLPLVAGAFLWTFAGHVGRRLLGRLIVLTLLLPSALAATLFFGRVAVEHSVRLATVISAQALLRDAPDPAASGIPVAEGLEVRLLADDPSGFHRVALSDGRTGYLATSDGRPH